jgi:glutamyl-tRNA synthetase
VKVVVVRFAPSPTGVLHIGSVRTALFNWLYARHTNGKFLLRIEDTDKLRSTDENKQLIFDALKWIGIDHDGEVVIQSDRLERHKQVAYELVENGMAYFCYCSQKELVEKKEIAINSGKSYKYDRTCRDLLEKKTGIPYVIRLKSEIDGNTIVNDLVQGTVRVNNSQLDDLVLLRSDGTPTYALSVVVDDHDMGITHVIRGDDHLTNTFRQIQIYKACGWNIPNFGHIPLIYGVDGAKLSKRHGAVSIVEYKDLGYLPEALSNYLLRLGWAHGDDEIISKEQAIAWFDIKNVGKSPSRFDINKLTHLNEHYIKEKNGEDVIEYMSQFMGVQPDGAAKTRILKGLKSLKERAKTIVDLAKSSMIYVEIPSEYDEKCYKFTEGIHLKLLREFCKNMEDSSSDFYEKAKKIAENNNVKFVEMAQSLRAALTGNTISPSVFEIIDIIGIEESRKRIEKFIEIFEK